MGVALYAQQEKISAFTIRFRRTSALSFLGVLADPFQEFGLQKGLMTAVASPQWLFRQRTRMRSHPPESWFDASGTPQPHRTEGNNSGIENNGYGADPVFLSADSGDDPDYFYGVHGL